MVVVIPMGSLPDWLYHATTRIADLWWHRLRLVVVLLLVVIWNSCNATTSQHDRDVDSKSSNMVADPPLFSTISWSCAHDQKQLIG